MSEEACINKAKLRQLAKETIRKLPLSQFSPLVNEQLKRSPLWQEAQRILFYWPLPDELSPIPLLELSLAVGKSCFLPRIDSVAAGTLRCSALRESPLSSLQRSPLGTMELPAASTDSPPKETELDLVLVPGLVFDRRGYRLGRGKGFYDRALRELGPKTITIGVIPQALLWEKLPQVDPWDQRVYWLVSEENLQPAWEQPSTP